MTAKVDKTNTDECYKGKTSSRTKAKDFSIADQGELFTDHTGEENPDNETDKDLEKEDTTDPNEAAKPDDYEEDVTEEIEKVISDEPPMENSRDENVEKEEDSKPPAEPAINYSFVSKAQGAGIMIDENGIYIEKKGETIYVSNITRLEYLYTQILDDDLKNRIRVVKINETITELYPEHLTSLNKFKRLLISQDNITFVGDNGLYQSLVKCILMLDNGKIVKRLTGLGKVQSGIYHLGNEIILNGERKPYQEIIWSGKDGVRLEKCGKMRIDPDSYQAAEIWKKIHATYGVYAYIMIGYATATLFFDELIRKYGYFPILYITGKSGTGKSKMAEIISNIMACDSELFTVNCDSLSTHIGVDEKNQSLTNLPLILNEVNHKWFPLLKSRYDGEGAIKASSTKANKTLQRNVKGSTIVTSVCRPQDSQVVSRSVFMDTSSIERDIGNFSELYHNRRKLSGFITAVLLKVKCTDVIAEIDKYQENFHSECLEPRIITNYAIIAGSLTAVFEKTGIKGYNKDVIREIFLKEMQEAEKGLDPVYHLVINLRSLISEDLETDFMTWDEKYVYVHIEGLWQYLPQSFCDQYYRKLEAKDIKNMFANSTYIARYGESFAETSNDPKNGAVISHSKKIKGKPKRCVFLLREKL